MKKALQIYAVCHCGYYDFPALIENFSQSYGNAVNRDVLQISWPAGNVFVFSYGVVVFWNAAVADRKTLLERLEKFTHEPLENLLEDEFTYELNAQQTSLKNDHICIKSDDVMTQIAISHGIAQSTKLNQFEARVQRTITATEYIPERIASTGKSGLWRKELAKMRGFLYLTKSEVMLHYDLLDVPEFFWEHPEFQSIYTMVSEYLETRPRIEVLNKKLETIQDLLQMIADEQNHAHSHLLEWIIIWLIAIDIVIMLVKPFLAD